ncbi:MAG: DUF456 domain-containing protein [bacterium]|nr:DUF456 domain-containing protein [bacterium]
MTFVPMLPAFWYLILGALTFGFVDGFVHLTSGNFGILLGLFGLSIIVDWSAGLLGAKFGGAGWKSLLCGMLGSLIGFFLLPPFGIFIGLFFGVLLGELYRRKNAGKAVEAATGAILGSLAGVAINVCLAVSFIVLFVLFALS